MLTRSRTHSHRIWIIILKQVELIYERANSAIYRHTYAYIDCFALHINKTKQKRKCIWALIRLVSRLISWQWRAHFGLPFKTNDTYTTLNLDRSLSINIDFSFDWDQKCVQNVCQLWLWNVANDRLNYQIPCIKWLTKQLTLFCSECWLIRLVEFDWGQGLAQAQPAWSWVTSSEISASRVLLSILLSYQI